MLESSDFEFLYRKFTRFGSGIVDFFNYVTTLLGI